MIPVTPNEILQEGFREGVRQAQAASKPRTIATVEDLDATPSTAKIGASEWGTDYWGDILSEPDEEHARAVARKGKANLYSRPPMGQWERAE